MPIPASNCIKQIQERREFLKHDLQAPGAKGAVKCPTDSKKKGSGGHVASNPIVLSKKRFQQIVNGAFESQNAMEEQRKEKEQMEILKRRGEEMASHFTGDTRVLTYEEKIELLRVKAIQQASKARESLDAEHEKQREIRQEKLANAEQLVKKLLPGPRSLRTAALQSEILRARDIQMKIKEDFEKAVAEQEKLNREKCSKGNLMFIGEELERMEERRKFEDQHKKETLKAIKENERRKVIEKEMNLIFQRQERKLMDMDVAAHTLAEKEAAEKKRVQLRRNLVEARIMAEEQKTRERMRDELDDRLCCVYNSGKFTLDKMKKQRNAESYDERLQIMNRNYEMLSRVMNQTQSDENERLQREIAAKEAKFAEEEAKRLQKIEAAKRERINNYLQHVEEECIKKDNENEIKRFEIAQRFKNCETNTLFEKNQKEEKLERIKETREQLKKQEQERLKLLEEYETAERACVDTRDLQEDKYFFTYAKELIEDAEKKKRPLYPFERVVKEYKSRNSINCVEKIPKHLKTHMSIGCRQPGDSKGVEKAEEQKKSDPLNKIKAEITTTCVEIDKIFERQRCQTEGTPSACNSNSTTPRSASKRKGKKKNLKSSSPKTPPSSSRTRKSPKNKNQPNCYSIELQKINVVAAPSLF